MAIQAWDRDTSRKPLRCPKGGGLLERGWQDGCFSFSRSKVAAFTGAKDSSAIFTAPLKSPIPRQKTDSALTPVDAFLTAVDTS